MMSDARHHATIVDQFTRQAVPFSTAPRIRDEEALRLVIDAAGAGPDDTMLDVACGGGIVVCAFARVVRHATGIDLTPAMIAEARRLQAERGLANVSWQVGDVLPLPFDAGAFSIVTSRYAFHHLLDPPAVLREMARVCAPGGRVMLIDVEASPDPTRAAEFNRMEKLRDPSHTRALPLAELTSLFAQATLPRLPSRATGSRPTSTASSPAPSRIPATPPRFAPSSTPPSTTTASASPSGATAP